MILKPLLYVFVTETVVGVILIQAVHKVAEFFEVGVVPCQRERTVPHAHGDVVRIKTIIYEVALKETGKGCAESVVIHSFVKEEACVRRDRYLGLRRCKANGSHGELCCAGVCELGYAKITDHDLPVVEEQVVRLDIPVQDTEGMDAVKSFVQTFGKRYQLIERKHAVVRDIAVRAEGHDLKIILAALQLDQPDIRDSQGIFLSFVGFHVGKDLHAGFHRRAGAVNRSKINLGDHVLPVRIGNEQYGSLSSALGKGFFDEIIFP